MSDTERLGTSAHSISFAWRRTSYVSLASLQELQVPDHLIREASHQNPAVGQGRVRIGPPAQRPQPQGV